MSDQVIDNSVIEDKTNSETLLIIQCRRRTYRDSEREWGDVKDFPDTSQMGLHPPYHNQFHSVQKALEAIDISKRFRALLQYRIVGDDRTPMEIVESEWEYRIIEKTVTTATKIRLIQRNI